VPKKTGVVVVELLRNQMCEDLGPFVCRVDETERAIERASGYKCGPVVLALQCKIVNSHAGKKDIGADVRKQLC
jgi:hypothetical protein